MDYVPIPMQLDMHTNYGEHEGYKLSFHKPIVIFPTISIPYNFETGQVGATKQQTLGFLRKNPLVTPKILICKQGPTNFLLVRHWPKLGRVVTRIREHGLDGVHLDYASHLQVIRVKVSGDFTHDCPRYFDPAAHCLGDNKEGCNTISEVEGNFDMFAYEEEFYFMK